MAWVHNASQTINDQSEWPTILVVVLIVTIVMVVSVGLRSYVRAVMLNSMGSDDWICSIIYGGLAIGQTRWGLGLNLPQRPAINLDEYSVINYTGRPFYMIGITGFKLALCISYLRILGQTNRIKYRMFVWFVMISCTVLHLAGTFVLIFQCNPVRKSWKPQTTGSCLPNAQTFYVLAAITIFFDCVIFLLPIPLLVAVKINTRRKTALIGVFGLGIFTTVCSVLRLVQIITISKNGNSTLLVLWGVVEMNVGITLTSLPPLAPLFNYFREKIHRSYGDSNGQNSKQSHRLSVLQSSRRARIPATSSGPWRDRDRHRNSSQQEILRHNVTPTSFYEVASEEKGNRIVATTKVEVLVSLPSEGDMESNRRRREIGIGV